MRRSKRIRPPHVLVIAAIRRLCAASFLVRTAVIGVVTMGISGVAHAVIQPIGASSDEVALVDSIVAGEAALDQVPSDFASDMGYTPVVASGTLIRPEGGCSAPGGDGPDRFDTACQTHDLGYDMLRHAEMEGARLGAMARFELDWKLYVDLLDSCERPGCTVTATAYFGAVSANSIRQGYKTPHEEPTAPWAALVASVVGLGALAGMPVMRTKLDEIAEGRDGRSN